MPWYIRLLRGIEIAVYVTFFATMLSASSQRASTDPQDTAHRYTIAVEFDYFNWTMDAFGIKLAQASLNTPFYFDEPTRHQIVVDYLHVLDEILNNEYQLNLLYTDPSVINPVNASADLRAELSDQYATQKQLAPLAEAILQEQVSATLADLNLTTAGQPIPPVLFHISPLPNNIVISPRDRIQQDATISILPTLTVDQQEELETRVASELNVSALVVPVGGIGSYPTMVMRYTSIDWLADTISHEWIHNWLTIRPLGLNYETTPQLRTMNETTASIAGAEIAAIIMKHYYPELTAATSGTLSLIHGPVPPGGWPRPLFDYRSEMHKTRLYVDELLAAGKIEEAEAYMEMRRQVFWDNGYPIRKLNQAFFAFHGAYADAPGGAAGEDPVGPAVRQLRVQSTNLTDFLKTIAAMSTFEELRAAVSP
jgi:hypothetical protein